MEQILAFVTPCQPLTDRCKFSLRVFTSWISSGLVLGLILGIFVALGAKTPNPAGVFFNILFTIPAAICIFGLIGLAISSSRGDSNYQAGWYWYFFPIVTYLVIGFWIAFALIAFSLSLAGVKLPKPQQNNSSRRNQFNPNQVKRQKSEEFLDDFEKVLIQQQQQKSERLKRENFSEVEREEEIDSLSIRERILEKLKNSPNALIEDILTEEEMEELFLMILEAI